jgi:asparagine synthase (glutamine-hydrolysing)
VVDPAAIALFHISKLAREKATVLLSGEGSDEVFAGYFQYLLMNYINVFQKNSPNWIPELIGAFIKRLNKDKYIKYADWLMMPLEMRYKGTSNYLTPSLRNKYYNPDFLMNKTTYLDDVYEGYFKKVERCDPLSQMLYVDTKTWLVDDLLVKADKMTMAASIELRVPFLDYRLVELMSILPSQFKINNGEFKYLLKKIMEHILPRDIVHRKKIGFHVPTKNWLSTSMTDDIKDALAEFRSEFWFNPKELDRILKTHLTGREDHSKIIMSLLIFQEWKKQYINNNTF